MKVRWTKCAGLRRHKWEDAKGEPSDACIRCLARRNPEAGKKRKELR